MSRASRLALFKTLRVLRPGGVLFVGMAESLNGVLDEVQSVAPGAYTLRRA